MNKYYVLFGFIFVLISFVLASHYLFEQTDEEVYCVTTQNYLSTPYLANPNNMDGEIKELNIIVVEEINDGY